MFIIRKSRFHKDDKKVQEIEEELVVFSQGQHFGEWGLIEGKSRKASAVALEDVDMFLLDKRYFVLTIGVSGLFI
jgi:CRP-like cAMP-binding protein